MHLEYPEDPIIKIAAKIGEDVGSKWTTLPGSVYRFPALFGHSALSGTPAGAYHLTTDLEEVICSIVTGELRSGVDPKKAIKQVLTATDLNFAAVRPASKVTLDIAQRYPVGPFNVVPNILLPMVFNDSGLDAIRPSFYRVPTNSLNGAAPIGHVIFNNFRACCI